MPLVRRPAPGAGSKAADPVTSQDQPGLIDDLGSTDERSRWTAARAAAGLSHYRVQLAEALKHERSPRVREALFTSLAAGSHAQAVELIIPFVRSDDAQLRTGALDALHLMAAALEPYLGKLLADDDADVRLLACELVRDVRTDHASDLLIELLDREALPNVCASAVEILAEIGDARAVPALERCAARFRESNSSSSPFASRSIASERNRLD